MPKRVSCKIPPGQEKKLADAVSLVRTHYDQVLFSWRLMSPEQRDRLLGASPILARLLEGVV